MDQNYGLYIIIGIGLIFFIGTGSLILDCFIKPKVVLLPTQKSKPASYYYEAPYQNTYESKDYNVLLLEDDTPLIVSSSVLDDLNNFPL